MSTIAHKVCCTCKQSLPLSNFGKDSSSKDGLKPRCRACRRDEKIKALSDPVQRARIDEYNKEWAKLNPEKVLAARERRREKAREYGRKYYRRNKTKMRAYAQTYYVKNKAHLYAKNRAWIQANAERNKEAYYKWRVRNRGRIASWNHKRRSRKGGAGYTQREWQDLCVQYGNRCLCCGATNKRLTADHVVPLSKGGATTIDNIQPLCLWCNQSKGTKTMDYR